MTIFYYIFFLLLERMTAKDNPQPPTTDNHPPPHSISLSCGLWPRLPSSDHPWPPQPTSTLNYITWKLPNPPTHHLRPQLATSESQPRVLQLVSETWVDGDFTFRLQPNEWVGILILNWLAPSVEFLCIPTRTTTKGKVSLISHSDNIPVTHE